jgi:hypothetical protein
MNPALKNTNPALQIRNPALQICNPALQICNPALQICNPALQIINPALDRYADNHTVATFHCRPLHEKLSKMKIKHHNVSYILINQYIPFKKYFSPFIKGII